MENLEKEIETMLGIQAGITIALAALISSHPDYEKLQLEIARVGEHVAPSTLWPALSVRQRQIATGYVEFLQQIQARPPESYPLSQLDTFLNRGA